MFGGADLGLVPGSALGPVERPPIPTPVYGALPTGVEVEEVHAIEIRDRDGNDLITVIELLSPTNKYSGLDRDQYLAKRRQVIRSQTHFVEIDLLRGGPRLPLEGLPHCDYCALVSRVEDRPQVGIWPWRLRDPLPVLPIPLRRSDADAVLDLKAVIDRAYDEQGYADYIYSGLPEPRLSPDDAAWAAGFLPKP